MVEAFQILQFVGVEPKVEVLREDKVERFGVLLHVPTSGAVQEAGMEALRTPAGPFGTLAVRTAEVTPRFLKDSTQELTFRLVGLKEDTWLELQFVPFVMSQPFQLRCVHPGSPSWKKVAIPKWMRADICPWYANCCGVGMGKGSL